MTAAESPFLPLVLVLACGCAHRQPGQPQPVEPPASACRLESDEPSYSRGEPLTLRVWCANEPRLSPARRVVDDLLLGRAKIVVTSRGSELRSIATAPISAPHLTRGHLGFSYSIQTYDLAPADEQLDVDVRLELDGWCSNTVRVRITSAPSSGAGT